MATIVNNTTPPVENRTTDDRPSNGFAVALIVLLAVLLLLFAFGRGFTRNGSSGGSGVNVPERVDVNVNGGASPSGGSANQ